MIDQLTFRDDAGSAFAGMDFSVTADWNSGFNGQLSLNNLQTSTLSDWTLTFYAPFDITNLWGATLVSSENGFYTIEPPSWKTNLSANETIEIGFTASGNAGSLSDVSLNDATAGNASSSADAPTQVTVTGGSVTEADPTMMHMHDDGAMHMHDDGHRDITFRVALDLPATEEVTLTFATADGTAVADTTSDIAWDYHTATGTLIFAEGEQIKEVTVAVHPDTLVEGTETFSLTVSGDDITGELTATGTIYDNDGDASGDHGEDAGNDDMAGSGATYTVGNTSVITGFDPTIDTLDLGSDSIHNQVPVDTPDGFMMLHMFNASRSTLVDGVNLAEFQPGTFAPIADAHLQQDLSAALAWENGKGLVREDTVYIRSHEQDRVETVDFDPATDTISFFYLSVRGDGQLNFAVEQTAEGARFYSPLTGQSLTLRGVSFDDLGPEHFEWRANQLEDNIAVRMGLADVIDGFEYVGANVFSGKSVEMAGLVDRAPYHSQPDYTGTPIGNGGVDDDDDTGADGGNDDASDPITVTVTGGSVTEADPGMDHMHDDGSSHVHDDGHRHITFQIALDGPVSDELVLGYTTADGTAVADTSSDVAWDYHTATGTLTFAPGEELKTVVVAVHPDQLVEETETFTLSVSGANVTGVLEATGTILDDDGDDTSGDEDADDGSDDTDHGGMDDGTTGDRSQGTFVGGGQTYSVGQQSVISGFDPVRDVLNLGGDSIHNQIPVDTPDGFMMLHMFNPSKSTLVEGVSLADLFPESFAPISDSHLQQDLSAALAWEDGSGLVRPNTVYIRSHQERLEQIVDFDPATDKISFYYLSVRGDGELNFSVEQTSEGVRFYSPLTGQSMTLRGITFDDLNSDHFEWRANQLEDNVASRMNLSAKIDGFQIISGNVFSGKSVAMAGLVDRAPYHSQPDYTGTPIGQVGDPSNPDTVVPDPDDGDAVDGATGGGGTGGASTSAATPGDVDPEIVSAWNTGYNVEASFTPNATVNGWTVLLRVSGDIINIWNADIEAQDGDVYTLVSKGYNASLQAGQSTSFGFQVAGDSAYVEVVGQGNPADDPMDDPADDPVDDPIDDPADDPVDNPIDDPADDPADDPMDDPVDPAPLGGNVLNGPLSTQGTEIIDADGKKVDLKGVNWFGFETDTGVLHGLWARNMESMLDEIEAFGFNLIRLPFAGELALNDRTPSSINAAENPELSGLTSHEILKRFLDAAAERGIGVLLDMHRTTPGSGPEGGGLIPDQQAFLDQWAAMADMFGDHPAVIGFDLYNEPHGYSWQDWAGIAETAGNMLLASHPDELIIVEGVETYQGDSHWWGGNLQGVADRPVVLNASGKLVYSPHEYATSVFDQPYFSQPGFDPEADLPEIFKENWGFIEEEEIAPLLLGEFGSTFASTTDQAWGPVLADYLLEQDIDWAFWAWNPNSGDTGGVVQGDWQTPRQEAFTYLLDALLGEGQDGSQTPIDDPIDDPVDDLVDDPADDPASVSVTAQSVDEGNSGSTQLLFTLSLSKAESEAVTLDFTTQDGSAQAGEDYAAVSGQVTFAAGETTNTVSVDILGDTTVETDETLSLRLSNVQGNATLATNQATATLINDDTAPATDPSESDVSVSFSIRQSWNGGFVGDLTITNDGDTPLSDWEVAFTGDFTIGDIWGASVAAQDGDAYTLVASGWTSTIAPGQSATFGFVGRGGSGDSLQGLSLNGAGLTPPAGATAALQDTDQDVEAALYDVDEIKFGGDIASSNSDVTEDTVLVQSNDFGQTGHDGHNAGGINPTMNRGLNSSGQDLATGNSEMPVFDGDDTIQNLIPSDLTVEYI